MLDTAAEALRREGLSDGVIAALKIAQATALRLLETRIEDRPILSSWDALGDYLTATMAHLAIEQVRVLFLNAKNMLLANEAMWSGSRSTRPRSTSAKSSPAPSRSAPPRSSSSTTIPAATPRPASRTSA